MLVAAWVLTPLVGNMDPAPHGPPGPPNPPLPGPPLPGPPFASADDAMDDTGDYGRSRKTTDVSVHIISFYLVVASAGALSIAHGATLMSELAQGGPHDSAMRVGVAVPVWPS